MIKIVATLCSLAAPENCREVQVTSTDYQDLSMHDCYDVAKLAKWMEENHPADRLAGWKCVLGKKQGQQI